MALLGLGECVVWCLRLAARFGWRWAAADAGGPCLHCCQRRRCRL